ncbi:alpha/beta hydrolase [Roseateles puraquae]|jgi:fermentation-respiration switch protein FrsA (DUF1100 family)|uniref:Esterase n=1 Tax=Roseateles puraquae TaxID=431059 RepID=A0A254NBG0_9BURK|nr:alpha/beta hydrolase [Roseateles puraquae]MDG0852585.1 alpha/beta hydrolase [Roseateles puraquae]OWR05301.1 esterase [Roseateles puraquae]
MRRTARWLLALLVVSLALTVAASLIVGEWLTRPVRSVIGPLPAGLLAEEVHLPVTPGQAIAGWFLPGRPGEGAVLLLHGVRGNRLQMLARARWLQQEGIASLLVDLPAHGESDGKRIGFGRLEAPAVDAALAWLRIRCPGERIGGLGVSLGGASLLFAARQPELDALVIESVYPSFDDAVRNRLAMRLGMPAASALTPMMLAQVPWRLGFGADQLRPLDAIRAVRAPLFVAAGAEDRHTPWRETEALFAGAAGPKTLMPVAGAAHVDLHAFDAPAYEARLGPWLHQALRRSSGP